MPCHLLSCITLRWGALVPESQLDPSTFELLDVVDAEYLPIDPTGEVLGHGVMLTLGLSSPPGATAVAKREMRALVTSPESALLAAALIEQAGMRALNGKKGKPLDQHDVVLEAVQDFEIVSNAAAQRIAVKFNVLAHGAAFGVAADEQPETTTHAVSLDIPQSMELIHGLMTVLGIAPPTSE